MATADCFAVLGAGSWGTALAALLANNGLTTWLWGRDAEHIAALRFTRRNDRYLPGLALPPPLHATWDLAQALRDAAAVLVVVPSHAFRSTLKRAVSHLREGASVAWATKGLEPDRAALLHEVAAELLPPGAATAVLSGPTFATEVAAGLPTAVTVASSDAAFARSLATALHSQPFRVYTSDDMIGVEVGGAVKNVLAIAAGIADGLGFGANTRAALITRGLAEMMRLGVALGGHRETFMGLAGLGDLVLTCTEDLSRNRRLGLGLAGGQSLEQALQDIGQVVEGVRTAREVVKLAEAQSVSMPIAEQVYQVLYMGTSPHAAVRALLNREQKPEMS